MNSNIYSKVSFLTVEADQAGQRIDNFLSSRLKGLPRSRLYRLLRKGEVRVNKGRVKPEYRVEEGDSVRIPPLDLPAETAVPALTTRLAQLLAESILFEDAEWLVVDKPNNLAVHGGSGQSLGLIEAMRQLRDDCRYLELCHRIDKDTSGCLVIAKKRTALKRFHAALREKRLEKNYLALVVGRWPRAVDFINAPLKKNVLQSGERMVFADKDGKLSQTRFKIEQAFGDHTLIQAQPVTGRTHQIRVHTKIAGFPIVGDVKYGVDAVNKAFRDRGYKQLFLHARSITLPKAESGFLTIESPCPQSWVELMDSWKS